MTGVRNYAGDTTFHTCLKSLITRVEHVRPLQ